mmetsp:Transcript_28564/g.98634  ORF Transcript_28564/g.98634 Transcript_28564/m.98634 type:complete len:463 (-) Transcript_28564:392-1780(-)
MSIVPAASSWSPPPRSEPTSLRVCRGPDAMLPPLAPSRLARPPRRSYADCACVGVAPTDRASPSAPPPAFLRACFQGLPVAATGESPSASCDLGDACADPAVRKKALRVLCDAWPTEWAPGDVSGDASFTAAYVARKLARMRRRSRFLCAMTAALPLLCGSAADPASPASDAIEPALLPSRALAPCLAARIHGCLSTVAADGRCAGSTRSSWPIRSLAARDTFFHSGSSQHTRPAAMSAFTAASSPSPVGSNGWYPPSATNMMMPMENKSAALPYPGRSGACTSGAEYAHVPHALSRGRNSSASSAGSIVDSPKSATTTRASSVRSSSSTFSGLRSRCTMWCSCMNATACASCSSGACATPSGYAPLSNTRSNSSPPAISSNTRYTHRPPEPCRLSCSNTSSSCTQSDRPAASRNTNTSFSTYDGRVLLRSTHLTATSPPLALCRARTTRLYCPRPMSSSQS